MPHPRFSPQKRRLAGMIFCALFIFLSYLLWNDHQDRAIPYRAFAHCLSRNDMIMYGTDWCPHCQEQKEMFGAAFEFIDYVNCDFNKELCEAKNVTKYPTWYSGEVFFKQGVQPFSVLGEEAECLF
ncbi:MAG: hypothetical protein ACD_28C00052G0004 [uncultured bacterium]|nr:MAG: hypothetical protein ACD_28C00052G0004 [uncultured bacterium]KKT77220.1 MAG: hypothetical protein UW70_C0001G0018 [Candidatus Peregrinibacteria bacterium GW2011_GWA2_44_7]